jgi:hypothetical protein
MSKRQFEDIQNEIRELKGKIENLEKQSKKRNLRFDGCIPPHDVCRNVVIAYQLNLPPSNKYDGVMNILADYYGVPSMQNYSDAKRVPAKAIACYYSYERAAYHKNPTCTLETVLHEFFHHLHAEHVVSLYNSENAEQCAAAYAKAVIQLGNIP